MANTSLLDGQLNLGTSTTLVGSEGNFYKASVGDGNKFLVKSDLLNLLYPVGSIYMSVKDSSPAEILGGEWERLQDRFLVGAGNSYAVNATGGATSHAHTTGGHTLTADELPKHTHGEAGGHTHTKGEMNITGSFFIAKAGYYGNGSYGSGAFSSSQTGDGNSSSVRSGSGTVISMSATNAWSGNTSSDGSHTHSEVGKGYSHSHGDTGSTSNIPPYLAVYMWKRTA